MSHQIDRRSFLAGTVAAGAGGLLAACGSSSGSTSSTASGPRDGVTSATPKRGGTLVFGNEAEINSFDPAAGRWDESGINYARTVYDPLTIIDAAGNVQPYLAQSVTPNGNYTQWTIKVRPGVRFHDGTTCDAAAIAGSMNHFKSGELGLVSTQPIQSITTSDPTTVLVNLNQPWVPFDKYLAGGIGGQIGYIVAPAMVQQISANPNAQVTPIGTGPFKFSQWTPNDHFTAVRNQDYWRTGLPYLDAITWRPIPDATQRASSLQSGNIDMMHTDVAEVILEFQNADQYGYIDDLGSVVGQPDMDFTMLNLKAAPFTDLRVRQACAMAINTEQYKAIINKNLNPISNQPFVPGTPFYAPVSYPSFNPSQAKSLVQQVARDTSKPVSFVYGSTTDPAAVQAAQLVQTNFTAVGMQVQLQQFQQDDLINNALAGKFQAVEWRQFAAVDPDLNYLFWSPTTIFGPPLNIASNFARNTDPQVETLLQQGRRSTDPSARALAYQNLAERFAKDLAYLWTDRAVWAIVTQSKVQNWNNPTTPAGTKAYGMIVGTVWPTQIWVEA
ncbi:MAG TPA: ABC transporter substrate-binding protein [Acidimicrobiales bacterium]|nr:ABC transporter substrate-binding protein [Acidimicrobiales bacterium]